MARKIVCFGPGPKFKGGIANYNTALAKILDEFEDVEVYLISWIQQYPAIVPREFIDKSSKLDFLTDWGDDGFTRRNQGFRQLNTCTGSLS